MTPDPIEAEIVPNTQALAVRPATNLPTVQDLEQQFALAVRQRELLSEYIKKQLVPGKHFYQRGTQKPSLAKEGAEIILLPHNLAPDYEQIGGPEAPPADGKPYQITVKCVLRRKGDPDSFVGSGIGSAGSEKQKKDGSYIHRQEDKYLCHNATLKMAQKSAMIAATINSTAASEFFTQDLEDGEAKEAPPAAAPPKPAAKPEAPKPPAFATEAQKAKLLKLLEPARELATEFFCKLDWLLPTETLEDLHLKYVPTTQAEMAKLQSRLSEFGNGEQAGKPYEPHWEPEAKPPAPLSKLDKPKDDEAWRDIIIPVPPKGMTRTEYLKHPQTIGQLFDLRHGNDEEAQAARQRLWGFVNHYEAKPWVGKDGQQRPPSDTDVKFREALDAFAAWFERNHPGEKL